MIRITWLFLITVALGMTWFLWGVVVMTHKVRFPDNDKLEMLAPTTKTQVGTTLHDTVATTTTTNATATIGYVFSLIKCGDFQSSTAGLIDATVVMRHSIHMTSIRNPASGSKYDYKMYALVHRQAESCSHVFETLGIQVILVDPPVKTQEIQGQYLRENIHREWCCGSDEFIKLYAYTKIPHSIVVHVDSDFFFLQPMDELFDSMLYPANSVIGKEARSQIEMEFPKEHVLPERIEAFYTRDWPQVVPGFRGGRQVGFQAGFMVVRPNQVVFDELMEVIRKGNYVPGPDKGWGGNTGFVGFVGSMAMQGLLAYFYDTLHPEMGVELNQCRYNWMGMDTKYRAHPNFRPKLGLTGKCRSNREYCEECMHTNLTLIKNVHLTQCRKPWNCIGIGAPGGRKDGVKGYIDTNAGDLQQCLRVVRKWHEFRTDLEQKLFDKTRDEKIRTGQGGNFMKEVFMGHCSENFQRGYNPINVSSATLEMVPQLYE